MPKTDTFHVTVVDPSTTGGTTTNVSIDLGQLDSQRDSPAWAPYSAAVGTAFVKHVQATNQAGASWETLREIYSHLFAHSEAFFVDQSNVPYPYPRLRTLQTILRDFYKVDDPGAAFPSGGSAPLPDGAKPGMKVGDFLNDWLTPMNNGVDPKLSHVQFVELRHILYSQEDIQLLSPWELGPVKIW